MMRTFVRCFFHIRIMRRDQGKFARNEAARLPARHLTASNSARAVRSAHSGALSQRFRGAERNVRLPFVPPEDWHEPQARAGNYRIVVQSPGEGFRHVLTPDDVRARLEQLPVHFLNGLEVVQFSRMTRKKRSFPCYGMQWGAALYLYPIETSFEEHYELPPKPLQVTEARMYGGRWVHEAPGLWKLVWTEAAIRDFYLNNILIHELGHLVDDRNSSTVDRERYAEWFAIEHGYRRSKRPSEPGKRVVRRHGPR